MAARRLPRFDHRACVSCAACAEDCPVSCIAMETAPGRGPHAKPRLSPASACVGCGACGRACPVSAVAMCDTDGEA
ncbi:MAG: 4Fe-4S dicluster domain-containing protein [Spirochaetaceae bacterium]|nr:4Fe-4S dicluster domain-containing protein [Spirochaetaceae bacterium]